MKNKHVNKGIFFCVFVIGIGLHSGITQVKNINEPQSSSEKDELYSQDSIIYKVTFRVVPSQILKRDVRSILLKNGFYDSQRNNSSSGFSNHYELYANNQVVYDRATGLMWERSGSSKGMPHSYGVKKVNELHSQEYIDQLNQNRFAGYNNWRLPTLEEAMSLMESQKTEKDWVFEGLFIDPIFSRNVTSIWTADYSDLGTHFPWYVNFENGNCSIFIAMSYGQYVRAVRSVINK